MQDAVPVGQGAMAAILNIQVEDLKIYNNAFPSLEISNDNCPGQCVVSGEKELDKLSISIKKELKKGIPAS